MTENKKEQMLEKEISMEMAREVTGGSRGGYDSNGNFWYEGDDEFSGGGGGGKKPVPPAKKGPNKAKPAGAGGGTHTKNDNITNINNGGEQKIVNQGRNNSVTGNEIKM